MHSYSMEAVEISRNMEVSVKRCCTCLKIDFQRNLRSCENSHFYCRSCFSDVTSESCATCGKIVQDRVNLADPEPMFYTQENQARICPFCEVSALSSCPRKHLVCDQCFRRINCGLVPKVCSLCQSNYPDDNVCGL